MDGAPPNTRPTSTPSLPNGPPNGGSVAWLDSKQLFSASSSEISWAGSIAAFLLLFVGIFVGPIYDRGYLRALLLVGTFLVVFGHMMLIILAQGFFFGIDTGCLFVPCVAIIPQYFTTKMGAAMGLTASGSALGVGFPWTTRVIGFIALATLLIPISLMRLRIQPPKVCALVDLTAFTDIAYISFVLTSVIAYMGLFVILFYLTFTSNSLAFYLVPIFNAASVFGRTIPNKLADTIGPFNLLIPSALVSSMLMLCMMAVHSKGAVIVLALISGFMSGALIGLPPMCLAMLTKHKSRLRTRVGVGYAIIALGVLIIGPIGGAILTGRDHHLHLNRLWIFGGVSTVISGLGYAAIWMTIYGIKLNMKA
ncbi:major facilitator superfamily domain-containing protein [Phaeosphaeriaceae sp. PMI808]|nr:major facilitator superfamily domain-containing protein [Phaeosphaeriaceae sp. PMI808]